MNLGKRVETTIACGLVGDVVRTFGYVRLRVFGTSMVPSILPGDLICVQRANISEISCGEIAVYAREGRMIVHRVIRCADGPEQSIGAKSETLLITRGDRVSHNDSPVSSSELLGKVISIEHGNFQRRPVPGLHGWDRMIVQLLRYSDHATYLYLQLAALRQVLAKRAMVLVGGSNECQRATESAK
jgi:signal peptidase I